MTEVGPDRDEKPAVFQRLLAGVPKTRGPAPVHLWHPAYCGAIDMRISADGAWHYNGSPIGRMAMVKLFATILRKDADRYVLVTPVEMVEIQVDDAPFIAVQLDREAGYTAPRLFIRTNLDDVIEIGAAHPMRFTILPDGGVKPYIHVRGDLWALASRALTHELMNLGVTEMIEHSGREPNRFSTPQAPAAITEPMFGIRSGETFFPICAVSQLQGEE